MSITELAIKRPSLIVVLFAALGVLGLFSYSQLSYELLPKINPPVLTVTTIYPGASPYEVETSVTKVIEDAISGLDEIDAVLSTSQEGLSLVTVEFHQGADIDASLQNAQRKVGEVAFKLPSDARSPILSKFALDELPVLRVGALSSMPPREFYQFLKDHVQPALSQVAGVGQVTLIGGEEREIKVNLSAEKLKAYGISILQVTQAIKSSNVDFPTGRIKEDETQFVVRLAGKFSSLEQMGNLVIKRSKQGGDIRLSDVAEIQDGRKDPVNITRINGSDNIGILIQKQSDANAVEVSKLVRAEMTKLEKSYERVNLRFDIAQDGSQFTVDAANAVKFDLALAIVLVAMVMLLFLHSIRNSVIVMIAIPASLISTFIAIYAFGFTLNLMTLLGLSLVVGILVDDSIVVLENIYHHLEKGQERRTAALTGRNEIGFAALAITLVDVVIFVPLALTGGLIGNILRQFAVVVVVSTLLSLFVSFTVTPLLASRFAKIEKLTRQTLLGRFALAFEGLYEKFSVHYLNLLHWSLDNKGKVFLISVVLFISSLSLVPFGFIGGEFVSQSDRGEFAVTIELPSGSRIEHTNGVTQKVERMIFEMPEVQKVFTNVGASNEGLLGQTTNYTAELNVALIPKSQRVKSTDQVAWEIKQKILSVPGIKVRVNPIGIFGTANQTPVQIVVSGPDRHVVQEGAEKAARMLREIQGTSDIRLSVDEGKPETRVEIDRAKMAAFGLTMAEVGATLRVALEGDADSKFRQGDDEFDLRIALDEADRSKTDYLNHIVFINGDKQQVELQQFATLVRSTGATKLQRRDRNNAVTVFSQAVGKPSGSIGAEFEAKLAKDPLPNGLSVAYAGDLKNQKDSFGSLGLALIAGILFVYMVMVALYDSYVYPLVVLFSIPVAMVGALLALALMMKTLSIFSILGIIMLVGLVGKNAILLVDRTNQVRAEMGMTTYDALIEAGKSRLRPILMTTLTMIFGMLPIALSTSSGSEWKTGLAWALVGGLTSSMFLTLLLVPVVYMKIDTWKERFPRLFDGLRKKTIQPAIGPSGRRETVQVG
ncbi:MAG: efflux RND transporter permease subunit [Bacteroidetes bacterium]|nr:efflux RND transporter permease subunit [Bacteroidota bacterium]